MITISAVSQSKIYKVTFGSERVNGKIFYEMKREMLKTGVLLLMFESMD